MQTVILAGGPGTRLQPLTLDRPAALLPVANRPLIEHLLEHLVRHRVREATVCLHHRPYPIETYLGDGTRWGLRLRYALERRPLGPAGAVRAVAARWTEPVLVAFATALTTADLAKALAFHQVRGSALTLVVVPAGGGGEIQLDDEAGIVTGDTPGSVTYDFTGLAILDPRALSFGPARAPCDLTDDLVPGLIAAGAAVHAYVTAEPGVLVRTPADLALANRRALGEYLPGLVLPGFETRRGIRISRGAVVHRSARLVPPVLVGANAVIGRAVTVEGTVVGQDVVVGAGSTVRNSVLLERTYVGRGLWLDGALVDRDRIRRVEAGTWTTVGDPRLFGDTRAPLRSRPGSLAGRLFAVMLVIAAVPMWAPLGAVLALETRGRPLRARRVVGGRGDASLWCVRVTGPVGRFLRRLGLVRGPYLWSVVRGDLHWVGTSVRSRSEWEALAARADLPAAPPGLVTLADVAPGLRRQDRVALDRLYAATRTWRGDLRLLVATLRRRLGAGPAADRASFQHHGTIEGV